MSSISGILQVTFYKYTHCFDDSVLPLMEEALQIQSISVVEAWKLPYRVKVKCQPAAAVRSGSALPAAPPQSGNAQPAAAAQSGSALPAAAQPASAQADPARFPTGSAAPEHPTRAASPSLIFLLLDRLVPTPSDSSLPSLGVTANIGHHHGEIYCRDILEAGGGILHVTSSSFPHCISSSMSHEMCETLVNLHANQWRSDKNGILFPLEICDPTQNQSYLIPVHQIVPRPIPPREDTKVLSNRFHQGIPGLLKGIFSPSKKLHFTLNPFAVSEKKPKLLPIPESATPSPTVRVSNFVFPSWFDLEAKEGVKVDYMDCLSKPFEFASGGTSDVVLVGNITGLLVSVVPVVSLPFAVGVGCPLPSTTPSRSLCCYRSLQRTKQHEDKLSNILYHDSFGLRLTTPRPPPMSVLSAVFSHPSGPESGVSSEPPPLLRIPQRVPDLFSLSGSGVLDE